MVVNELGCGSAESKQGQQRTLWVHYLALFGHLCHLILAAKPLKNLISPKLHENMC